jgi:CheY-like chemotaxis protein
MNTTEPVILLLENSEQDARAIQAAFEKARVTNRILSVSNAAAAMAYLKGEGAYANRINHPAPIFALLALELPGNSELAFLAWLREDPVWKQLPVAVIAAGLDTQTRERCAQLGAAVVFQKPLKMEDLPLLVKAIGGSWAFQTSEI